MQSSNTIYIQEILIISGNDVIISIVFTFSFQAFRLSGLSGLSGAFRLSGIGMKTTQSHAFWEKLEYENSN